jgi:hypothetical protein
VPVPTAGLFRRPAQLNGPLARRVFIIIDSSSASHYLYATARVREKEEKHGKFHIFFFFFNPTKNGSLSFSFYPTAPLRAVKANHNERRGIRFGLLFRSDFSIFHAPNGPLSVVSMRFNWNCLLLPTAKIFCLSSTFKKDERPTVPCFLIILKKEKNLKIKESSYKMMMRRTGGCLALPLDTSPSPLFFS